MTVTWYLGVCEQSNCYHFCHNNYSVRISSLNHTQQSRYRNSQTSGYMTLAIRTWYSHIVTITIITIHSNWTCRWWISRIECFMHNYRDKIISVGRILLYVWLRSLECIVFSGWRISYRQRGGLCTCCHWWRGWCLLGSRSQIWWRLCIRIGRMARRSCWGSKIILNL